jgi:hypothetical protein
VFDALTVELLAHKYRYYILSQPVISDSQYDQLEKAWESEGMRLGFDMENYEPWVDFPSGHPFASVGVRAAAVVGLSSWSKCIQLAAHWKVAKRLGGDDEQ